MTGFITDLLTDVAVILDTASVGEWRPNGPAYGAAEVGIVLGEAPSEPDRVVALVAYPIGDDFSLSDSVIGIQVRTRGTETSSVVDDLDDAVFNALHGMWGTQLGTVRLVSLIRRSGVSLGTDVNKRWQRSSNFWASVHRPSPHRT